MQVRDEVCGMQFEAAAAAATTRLDGRTYYFCGARCRQKFEEHPGWYVDPGADGAAPTPGGSDAPESDS